MKEYATAEALQPQNIELMFWKAVSLLNSRRFEDAEKVFDEVFKLDARWRELLKRLPAAGIIKPEDDIIKYLNERTC